MHFNNWRLSPIPSPSQLPPTQKVPVASLLCRYGCWLWLITQCTYCACFFSSAHYFQNHFFLKNLSNHWLQLHLKIPQPELGDTGIELLVMMYKLDHQQPCGHTFLHLFDTSHNPDKGWPLEKTFNYNIFRRPYLSTHVRSSIIHAHSCNGFYLIHGHWCRIYRCPLYNTPYKLYSMYSKLNSD